MPCIRCNERVKFKDLLETAKDLDADCMATGSLYPAQDGTERPGTAFRRRCGPRSVLFPVLDDAANSSIILRFPLGHLASKAETRALAAKYGLSVADKPDSQDICFVPNGNYASVIEKLRPGAAEPGEIVHVDGRVLGEHPGVIHYTIGQRRGLGHRRAGRSALRGETRCRRPPRRRRPERAAGDPHGAGARDQLAGRRALRLAKPNGRVAVTDPLDPAAGRGRRARPCPRTEAEVELLTPEEGVAPGQACVFYDPEGSRVFGGGWIWRGY